ncbi:hypothetical protein EMPS_00478 [Entomortierella parvispora]|uniref:ER-bound oxygenase mpaB/mpaB'/Rubber oxygenase catalytic domain-containing protein n=1 Tax=Entomortierella parvispora TaxID=205924 RepID=A0A9P3H1S8_9FUNG|nr:hypothetical protein EMPS_00478 [Entomortierella parvispora]
MACPAGYSLPEGHQNAPYAAATEVLEPGQRIAFWDYDVMWTEDHIPASRLEPLRKIGDVLADNAFEALQVKPGADALTALRAYVARPECEQESPAPRLLMDQLMTVPDWVDWDKVRRGQDVYWRYSLFISHALLHFSLAGGFVIPKITKVLNSTGYLSGKSTKKRVLETQQFVLDVVHSPEYLFPGTGTAWESIVQVRFLHAGVRARLAKISRAHSKYYDMNEHGVPINQEDLLATLFGFSNIMWRVMEARMDIQMTTQEREDYLHLWRYVGYIMGVDDILGAVRTPDRADACIESITLHLSDPDTESGKMCATLLRHMAPKPLFIPREVLSAVGLPDPFKFHMALAESLLGPKLWKANGLPTMSRPYRFLRTVVMYFLYAELWVSSNFPWWLRIRKPLFLEFQYMMVRRHIGRNRTQFELTEEPKLGNGGLDGQIDGWLQETYSQRIWPKLLTAASAAVGAALLMAPRK